jgi:hypothetical protein
LSLKKEKKNRDQHRKGYVIDSIKPALAQPFWIHETIKPSSLIKSGNQYRTIDFEEEKTELLHILEITGIFFQPTNNFDIDTINKKTRPM